MIPTTLSLPNTHQKHYQTAPIPSVAADSVGDILIAVPHVCGQSVPETSIYNTKDYHWL